jgi:hypothetical protein
MSVQPANVRGIREPACNSLNLIGLTKSALGITSPVLHHPALGKWLVRLATQTWAAASLSSVDLLSVACGQGIGTLKGTFEDSTEAAIPEASVALANAATGKQFSSATDELKVFRRVKDSGVSGRAEKADCSWEAPSQ